MNMNVPEIVTKFFSGSEGINILASPRFLEENTGYSRIYLPSYDIFHCGKDKEKNSVYTKYRILGKESLHNTIQGVLEVHITEGYGIKSHDGKDVFGFLRPNDVKKMVTEGSTSIKRNSVIILRSGIVVRLEDVENFCDLPIIDRARLVKTQTILAISKREIYKEVRGSDNWAHVKKGALERGMEKSVHSLLLPYYRKYRTGDDSGDFFRVFMEDLLVVCGAHHANFTKGEGLDELVIDITRKNRKRNCPSLNTETRPRKKWGRCVEETQPAGKKIHDPISIALKNKSKSSIASIVF